MATRRAFLRGVAAGLGVAACRAQAGQPAEGAAYVGVETAARSGLSRAAFFSASGARLASAALDFRAHGMAQHGDRLVVFPRRPGTVFAVVDVATLEIAATVAAPAGRRFYGHGAFAADGRTLLITENDLDTLQGAVAVYEMTPAPRRLGAVPLPGAGPHEIIRARGGAGFHIALGGLQTHPDYGRTPLNLRDFRSRMLTLNAAALRVEAQDPWPGAEGVSLRHAAQDALGRLYVGGQVADPTRAGAQAVLWVVEDGRATACEAGARLGGYVSSVAAHGRSAVVTSKTAGVALTLDGARLVAAQPLTGASAAGMGPGITATAGFAALSINGARAPAAEGFEFDNHGLALL